MEYTQADVDRILEASEMATIGPWSNAQDSVVRSATLGDPYLIADIMTGSNAYNDAEFIAGAPILAEEVKRLRAEIANMKEEARQNAMELDLYDDDWW